MVRKFGQIGQAAQGVMPVQARSVSQHCGSTF
jgi:hypothetical protein